MLPLRLSESSGRNGVLRVGAFAVLGGRAGSAYLPRVGDYPFDAAPNALWDLRGAENPHHATRSSKQLSRRKSKHRQDQSASLALVLSPSVWPTFVLMVPIHFGFIQKSFEIHREALSFDRDGGERPRDREKSRRISDEEQGKKLARENKRVSLEGLLGCDRRVRCNAVSLGNRAYCARDSCLCAYGGVR
jgi:hypothetical protein